MQRVLATRTDEDDKRQLPSTVAHPHVAFSKTWTLSAVICSTLSAVVTVVLVLVWHNQYPEHLTSAWNHATNLADQLAKNTNAFYRFPQMSTSVNGAPRGCCTFVEASEGFWPIHRQLYTPLNPECSQLPILTWGLVPETGLVNRSALQYNHEFFSNTTLPNGMTGLQYLSQPMDLEPLRNKLIISIGDSVDRVSADFVCVATGGDLHLNEPSYNNSDNWKWQKYGPSWCHVPSYNLTVLVLHHFGLMHDIIPAPSGNWDNIPDGPDLVNYYLPRAMAHINKSIDDTSLIILNSAWDFIAKEPQRMLDGNVIARTWQSEMERQFLTPLRQMFPDAQRTPIAIRTPTPVKDDVKGLNLRQVLRASAYQFARLYHLHVVPFDRIFEDRWEWAPDTIHYQIESIHYSNVVLNFVLQHEQNRKATGFCAM